MMLIYYASLAAQLSQQLCLAKVQSIVFNIFLQPVTWFLGFSIHCKSMDRNGNHQFSGVN